MMNRRILIFAIFWCAALSASHLGRSMARELASMLAAQLHVHQLHVHRLHVHRLRVHRLRVHRLAAGFLMAAGCWAGGPIVVVSRAAERQTIIARNRCPAFAGLRTPRISNGLPTNHGTAIALVEVATSANAIAGMSSTPFW